MKKNYRYTIGGESIILSPEEHEKIVSGVRKGQSQFWLRNETLMINMAVSWYIKETDQPTDEEEKIRNQRLKLESPKWEPSRPEIVSKIEKMRKSFKEKHGWG